MSVHPARATTTGLRTLLTYPLTVKYLNSLEGIKDYENLVGTTHPDTHLHFSP